MDWKEYEEVTKYIYETLGAANGVKIECFGSNCKVLGKSRVSHQIDVLTNHSDGLHSYKTAVECKYWEETINKDIIMKVAQIVEDGHLNKGVIVSKNGFTPDAISFAKYKNIGLIELREPNEKDWEGRVKNIEISSNMLVPQIKKLDFIVTPNNRSSLEPGPVIVDWLDIKHSDGSVENIKRYVQEFQNELCSKVEGETIERIFKFNIGAVIVYKPTGEETQITGIKFTGILSILRETIEIKGGDHIYLIMKSIFEDKSYTITRDGKINEREK